MFRILNLKKLQKSLEVKWSGHETAHCSIQYRGKENVSLYIHYPILLHGVMLN
jgi:hypothetical protein